jgi:hypothetical protein
VAGREAEQLVAEADPEHRDTAQQLAHDLDLVCERLGVAGAVREQDGVVAGELVRVDLVREDRHVRARPGEPPQDRPLHAVVDDSNTNRPGVAINVRV